MSIGIEYLLEWCPPGTIIYTQLEHVSPSGMCRWVKPYVMLDNEPHWIGGHVANVTGFRRSGKHDGNKIPGCGMDAGFELVHSLSYRLYPDGFGCIGDKCPSNDHPNGDRCYTPHSDDHPHWHKSGGYALKHRWL